MNNIYEETKFLMKKYNLTEKKKLGQNFLIDDEAIDKIVDSANLTKEDLVIEIGPGLGTLTSMLLEKARKVIAIELDDRMVKILQDRFLVYNNFELINEDVLKVNLPELIEKNGQYKNVKVVANLPYYITTPIIMKLLENRLKIDSITIMIQKEVAERIVANPGTKLSGAITYSVHYYAEPEEVTIVPNISFIPSPEVDSEVIKLVIRKEPPVELKDEKLFFNIIKASFMQRRKTLLNALVNAKVFLNKEEMIECKNNIHTYCANGGSGLQIWLEKDNIRCTYCPLLAEVHPEFTFLIQEKTANFISQNGVCAIQREALDNDLIYNSNKKEGRIFSSSKGELYNVCRFYSIREDFKS